MTIHLTELVLDRLGRPDSDESIHAYHQEEDDE